MVAVQTDAVTLSWQGSAEGVYCRREREQPEPVDDLAVKEEGTKQIDR